MTPLEMIAEWRKGCSCGGAPFDRGEGNPPGTTSPAQCQECTVALIDALESVLRVPNNGQEFALIRDCEQPTDAPRAVQIGRRFWTVPKEIVLTAGALPSAKAGDRFNFRFCEGDGPFFHFTGLAEPVMGEPLGSGKIRVSDIKPVAPMTKCDRCGAFYDAGEPDCPGCGCKP